MWGARGNAFVRLAFLGFMLIEATASCSADQLRSEREARIAAEAEARHLAEENARLEGRLKEKQAKIDDLLTQLASAKDEAVRLELQKQLADEREKQKKAAGGGAK